LTSSVTERANAFVATHLDEARGLGTALAELLDEPDGFVEVLTDGLRRLADPAYLAEQERVAPGGAPVIGTRWALIRPIARQLREPLRESSSSTAVSLAQRLAVEPLREVRLFSHIPLARSLADDPERSWQVMRRLARAATDWICTDDLAGLVAQGVLNEPFRWAELEQLVYSEHRFERRLVGAALAVMPFEIPRHRRSALAASKALPLIGMLIGDAEETVQKALSWALRSWALVDQQQLLAFLQREAETAARTNDGHRAWVIRDGLPALSTLPKAEVAAIRARVDGIRRVAAAPDTSAAHETAARFRAAGVPGGAAADRVVAQQGERMQRQGVAW
jgi:3-methyladenine DNA glycosylase AlkD